MPAQTHTLGEPTVVGALSGDLDGLTQELVERIVADDDAYADAGLLSRAELAVSCRENLAAILAVLTREDAPLDRSAAWAVGRFKADRDVPLAAVLHAFRLGGRLIWERVLEHSDSFGVDGLPGLAAQMWAVIDEMSSAVTEAYTEAMVERARSDVATRELLLRDLLWGEVHDRAHLQDHLRVLRLPERAVYLVVSVDCGGAAAPGVHGAEQSLLRHGLRSLWMRELRSHVGLVVLADPDHAARVMGALAELGVRSGVSAPFDSLQAAATALREAQLAMLCGTPGSASVTAYGDRPVALLLARTPDGARDLARAVLGPVLDLPDQERAGLLATLSCWFECDGSASAVAEKLHFHRNTIHQRLRRIEHLTGRTCSRPAEASELYWGLQAIQLGHV
jgi:hypothetical protein